MIWWLSSRAVKSLEVYWVDSSGRHNTSVVEVLRNGFQQTTEGHVAAAGKHGLPMTAHRVGNGAS
jgi:hypothetical protein